MSTPLELDTVRRSDGEVVLTAVGEVDLSNINAFSDALQDAINQAAGKTLTVDLSDLGYLDSAAVNALYLHAEHIRIIAHPHLMSIFTISGLAELTTIEPAATAEADVP
jgi:anti-anti-sigma factor